ncbi:MAG: hypothetical protein AAGD86_00220 [Pseudomonadota bacterium]
MRTSLAWAATALLASSMTAVADTPASDAASSAAEQASAQALRARYPARPTVRHSDGSLSQYVGAGYLQTTVVRIGAEGKLETLCTADTDAAERFTAADSAPEVSKSDEGAQP